jgi:phosphate transport system protein
MPEQRQAFQRQLDAIDAKVIELLDLLAADLGRATLALPDGSNEVVRVLAEHGLVIGLLCPDVEKLTKTAILLQAPVASDLRFLLCVLRILPELERSHHLVVQLAARASQIRSEDLSPRSRELVERMGSLASDMFRRTADSWYQRDHSAAGVLAERDNQMDELHASLTECLREGRPIGSGQVEGKAKTLGLRLKASGARWKRVNVRPMASLVCVRPSSQWNAYWAATKAA